MKILNFLEGKKTFIIGFCGLVWGFYTKDHDLIITSLGLIGIRQSVYTLAQKFLTTNTPQ